MESCLLADQIVAILDDRKGKQIERIDTSSMTIVTDYFVVCSGTSTTHVRGLADEVLDRLGKEGLHCSHVEGYDTARWILLDYLDVVVHIFVEEDRDFYSLERLWRGHGGTREKEKEMPHV